MKKLLLTVVSVLLVACMVVPTFAAVTPTPTANTTFYAGSADKGFHAADGVISAGEYDVKFEGQTPTSPLAKGVNPNLGGGTSNTISNNAYFDYDENYFYIGAMDVDGARDASVGDNFGTMRVMGTIALASWVSNSQAGTFGFDFQRFSNGTGCYAKCHWNMTDSRDYGTDISKYVVYNETVNPDGTVTEVFEAAIPRSLVEQIAGATIGDAVYVRFTFETDSASEKGVHRYTIGHYETSEVLLDHVWGYDNGNGHGNPFKVFLSAQDPATEADPSIGRPWDFYVGGAANTAVDITDGKITDNDNYLVKIEDIGIDPSDKGFMYLFEGVNKTFSKDFEDKLSLYIGKDDTNFYFAQVVEESAGDVYDNLFDLVITTPDTDNVVFVRLWGKWDTSAFLKQISKTADTELAMGTLTQYHNSVSLDGSETRVLTQEASVSIADMKTILGVDDLSHIQFNVRIQMDPVNTPNSGDGRTNMFVAAPYGTSREIPNTSASVSPAKGYAYFNVYFDKACSTGTAHDFGTTPVAINDYYHAIVCKNCGNTDAQGLVAHSFGDYTALDDTYHAKTCVCGKTVYQAHDVSEYTYSTTNLCYREATCTVTTCGKTFSEKYVPADGYLLREYGQQWLFTGTAPSEEVGSAVNKADGVIIPGEYNVSIQSASSTNAARLDDYSVLYFNADEDYFYVAIEMYEKSEIHHSTLPDHGSDRNHHHSMGWLKLYPVAEGKLQSANTAGALLAFNNYEGGEGLVKYGARNGMDASSVVETNVKFVALGIDNFGIEYGKNVFEFKLDRSKMFTGVEDFDKLSVGFLQGMINAGANGVSLTSQDVLKYTIPTEAAAVHGANGYHVIYIGDITDHEEFLDAPTDGSRGSFYYGECATHNYGSRTYHNDSYEKQTCADCGHVEYYGPDAHTFDEWLPAEEHHYRNCTNCVCLLTEDHYADADDFTFTDVVGEHQANCAECDQLFKELYVPNEGFLLKALGQRWFFTGAAPSVDVGPATHVMDGVVSAGEYDTVQVSARNTETSYLYDHAKLHVDSDGEYVYFALESYERAVNNTHHRAVAWVYLVPAVEGIGQTTNAGEYRISMNNYETSKYGVVADGRSWGQHAMVKDFTIGYTELGNADMEYGKVTFEFKVAISELLGYAKTYISSDIDSLDKLYIKANIGHNRTSDGLYYGTVSPIYSNNYAADAIKAYGIASAGYQAYFLGAMSDHEDVLAANGEHGNFYTPCDTCSYGELLPHNADYCKRYCADCGSVEYVEHTFSAAVNNEDGTHTATCTACGYDKVEAHDADSFNAIPDTNTHAAVCSVCGGSDVVEHKYANGVVITPAKHTEEGLVEFTCIFCDDVKQEVLPKTADHRYRGWKEVDGKHVGTCECGATTTEDHVWNGGAITAQPTYEAEGTRTYTCTTCRATKEESIAKLEAPVVTPPADDPADTPADDTTDDTADDDKGCGASVTAMGIALVATLGMGVAFVAKKKED